MKLSDYSIEDLQMLLEDIKDELKMNISDEKEKDLLKEEKEIEEEFRKRF